MSTLVEKDRRDESRRLVRVCLDVVAGYVISRRYIVGECQKKDRRGRQAGE